ncbi:MAG: radical SAM protein [Methylococcaceae bacterium]|nr:radical SAM protein [Methylococcaceae bacterium]
MIAINTTFPIIDRLQSSPVDRDDILTLLTATGALQEELFRRARDMRHTHCGDLVHLRGVIEISNYCQKSCSYCAIRAPNKELDRYRMSAEEILDIAGQIHNTGIRIIFIQAGQDPKCDEILETVIPKIKQQFNTEVLLCLGERSKETYRHFRDLGADSYILKYETSDPVLYEMTALTPLKNRLDCARSIKQVGMKLGVGNIIGLPGQNFESLADDILLGYELEPDFVSASPFIANEHTPYEDSPAGDFNVTLNTMAINRLMHKTCLLPTVSALEKIYPHGQLMGLNAGANVITINFTPSSRRENYAIYSSHRFIVSRDHALHIIQQAGLKAEIFQ